MKAVTTKTATYELCFRLKEAGFPQSHDYHATYWYGDSKYGPCYAPTLSELIDSCEGKLASLNQCYKDGNSVGWDAISTSGMSGGTYKTPKEAVGNLFIELKKHG